MVGGDLGRGKVGMGCTNCPAGLACLCGIRLGVQVGGVYTSVPA